MLTRILLAGTALALVLALVLLKQVADGMCLKPANATQKELCKRL